jgi:hypothetical protein
LSKAERAALAALWKDFASGVARVLSPSRRWILAGAGAVIVAAILLLIRFFPFSEATVTESLRETFPSNVSVDHFRTIYFPHPGCRAEGVTFRSTSSSANSAPLVTIQELAIDGSYADFLWRPHHVARVRVTGLRIQVPPLGPAGQFSGGYTDSRMTIGELTANGAVLEFARAGGKPAERFDIHELTFADVSSKTGMSYRVAVRNPTPPGEITSAGHFGPFQANAPGQTPVSGKYSLDQADLGVFRGIAGLIDSQGNFSGLLGSIDVQGTSDSTNFEVVRSGLAAPLSTRFQLVVNGLNGDVTLTSVNASYFNTSIHSSGSVAGKEGMEGKFTSLDFTVRGGHIQDILRLFVRESRPPMSGITNIQAHVTVPPEGKPFLQEVTLQGEFDIADGHFENPPRQTSVNELSQTARGEKKAKENGQEIPSETVAAHVHGRSSVHDGTATFTDLEFAIPGADASMHGTFSLLDEKIDLHGTVKMDAKFSQTTSGIKSLFAKVLDPFLDKKHGSVVPVLVNGTYSNPHFGVDLNPVK